VYVGNLSWQTSWQTLKDSFADYGCTHADVGTWSACHFMVSVVTLILSLPSARRRQGWQGPRIWDHQIFQQGRCRARYQGHERNGHRWAGRLRALRRAVIRHGLHRGATAGATPAGPQPPPPPQPRPPRAAGVSPAQGHRGKHQTVPLQQRQDPQITAPPSERRGQGRARHRHKA
jgi:hypothetical protein